MTRSWLPLMHCDRIWLCPLESMPVPLLRGPCTVLAEAVRNRARFTPQPSQRTMLASSFRRKRRRLGCITRAALGDRLVSKSSTGSSRRRRRRAGCRRSLRSRLPASPSKLRARPGDQRRTQAGMRPSVPGGTRGALVSPRSEPYFTRWLRLRFARRRQRPGLRGPALIQTGGVHGRRRHGRGNVTAAAICIAAAKTVVGIVEVVVVAERAAACRRAAAIPAMRACNCWETAEAEGCRAVKVQSERQACRPHQRILSCRWQMNSAQTATPAAAVAAAG